MSRPERAPLKRPLQLDLNDHDNQYNSTGWSIGLVANDQAHAENFSWWTPLTNILGPAGADVFLSDPLSDEELEYAFPASVEAHIESWYRSSNLDALSMKDQDGQVTDSPHPRLCYGMIHRSRIRLVGDMQRHLSVVHRERTNREGSCYILSIAKLDEKLHVVLEDTSGFALLNKSLNNAFKDQDLYSKVSLQALTSINGLRRAIREATRAKDAFLTVDIIVYGTEENRSEIGEHLAKQKIWLQKPDWYESECHYDNPHLLRLSYTQSEGPRTMSLLPETMTTEEGGLDGVLSDVYAKLTRATHLERTAGDVRLATQLMPHQEEALHFMLERENGPTTDEYSLWKPVTTETSLMYEHRITGCKNYEIPVETGGGILADEMGMGKTFSILALIVHTIHDAHVWSQASPSMLEDTECNFLSRATLVVVPSPLILNNWLSELHSRVGMQNLLIFAYHGTSRPTDVSAVLNHDIVLTTYQTLVSERSRGQDLLSKIGWFRIVLDEAHFIRRASTKFYRTVSEFEARSRWCLTGTPIQNHIDDIGALFAFLRIQPFDKLGMFRKHISLPYYENRLNRTNCQEKLRLLIDCICLRRERALLSLDNVDEYDHFINFSHNEQHQYAKTKANLKAHMELHPNDLVDEHRFGMFQAQLHLRLICNHGTYQQSFGLNSMVDHLNFRDDMPNLATVDGETRCDYCDQYIRILDTSDLMRLRPFLCQHTVCEDCRVQNDHNNFQCNKCPTLKDPKNPLPSIAPRTKQTSKFYPTGISSKIAALLDDLSKLVPEDKSIVFSCWTSSLDLIQHHLCQNRIQHCRIDGDLPLKEREPILQSFDCDPKIKVLIMTTGVGGFGINLIAANRVFLFEPQWNPSVESQAIGRTLRIGQMRKVRVVRYIVRGTIEEDIRRLQRNKTKIARMVNPDA